MIPLLIEFSRAVLFQKNFVFQTYHIVVLAMSSYYHVHLSVSVRYKHYDTRCKRVIMAFCEACYACVPSDHHTYIQQHTALSLSYFCWWSSSCNMGKLITVNIVALCFVLCGMWWYIQDFVTLTEILWSSPVFASRMNFSVFYTHF